MVEYIERKNYLKGKGKRWKAAEKHWVKRYWEILQR